MIRRILARLARLFWEPALPRDRTTIDADATQLGGDLNKHVRAPVRCGCTRQMWWHALTRQWVCPAMHTVTEEATAARRSDTAETLRGTRRW